MKNWKNAFFGVMAIIAFGIAFIACDNGRTRKGSRYQICIVVFQLGHH